MDRLACVDLPAFPLQLLLREHPDWSAFPSAVVEKDQPRGKILWVSETAREKGILPGQRYAEGLSLASTLRAGVISDEQLRAARDELAERLRRFSPDVEPGDPGVFWLSGAGLKGLFASATAWGKAIRGGLTTDGFHVCVAVGFTRFGTYALSRLNQPMLVMRDAAAEKSAALDVPLDRLDLDPALRDFLHQLGVLRLGQYLGLPPAGLLQRFGPDAMKLHQLASGSRWDPMQPVSPVQPVEARVLLDEPETDVERLLFLVRGALHQVLLQLAMKHHVLTSVWLDFKLDSPASEARPVKHEVLQPAEPTLDERVLMRLIHLRLESSPPPTGVRELAVGAVSVEAKAGQLALFFEKPRRDLSGAPEAFAQLRADFGNDAIRKAVLRDAHLPEAQFGWERFEKLVVPQPKDRPRQLIRRVESAPKPFTPRRHALRDDGWVLAGLEEGAVDKLHGPYLLSGGWWRGAEAHREYVFVETRSGKCLWLYWDRKRRRWYQQGAVE